MVVPEMGSFNLLSVGKAVSRGVKFNFDSNGCEVHFGNIILKPINKKTLYCFNIRRNQDEKCALAAGVQGVNINILHSWLGHAYEAYTKATAKSYGWKWTCEWMVCEHCALGKSKQKALVKLNSSPVEKVGARHA